MTALIVDIVIALLILVAAARGYRRGFVLTLCGFLAIFVALIGASVVSNVLSGPASRAIQPMIQSSIQQLVESSRTPEGDTSSSQSQQPPLITQEPQEQAQEEEELPFEELLALLHQSKVFQGFADAIQDAVNQGLVAASADAARVVSDYIAKQLAQIVLFLVSFILILVLWTLLSHALDLAFRLPVLSTLNHWSGAALGLLRGTVLIFIACQLLKGSFLPQNLIQESLLLRFFCTANFLSLLI